MRSVFFFLSCVLVLQGEIREVSSFEPLQEIHDPNCLVLVDLDNCLMESTTCFGHGKWFEYHYQKMKEEGMEKEQIIASFYPRWVKSQRWVKVKFRDPKAKAIIETLQNQGIWVLGFTHRRGTVKFSTLRQLQDLGLDFERGAPIKHELFLDYPHHPVYFGGVLFMNDYNEKGQVLTKFLKTIKYTPSSVVLIDDAESNVQSVEEALEDLRIPFLGLHYPYDHEPYADYRIGDIQEFLIGKILSDEAGETLLHRP